MSETSGARKFLIPIAVVVVLLVGAGAWFLFLRDDDPTPELETDTAAAGECGTATAPDSLDGEWAIAESCDSQAGLRIEESFANGLKDYVAVGRSTAVSGSIEIGGTAITGGSFTVDLTALEFTDDGAPVPTSGRVRAMQDEGLEIQSFPEASLALTGPVDFGEAPADGAVVSLTVPAELTLHGVTKAVEVKVEAVRTGDTIQITTAEPVPVVLADYEISKPSAPFVAEIADEGSFEFQVFLQQR